MTQRRLVFHPPTASEGDAAAHRITALVVGAIVAETPEARDPEPAAGEEGPPDPGVSRLTS